MEWKKLIITAGKVKDTLINATEGIRTNVKLEKVTDGVGRSVIRAVWMGESAEGKIDIDVCPFKSSISAECDGNSMFELWEKDGKRGVTLRRPKDVSLEVDWEKLNEIGTAKAAGIACATGAALGLLGWLGLTLAGKFLKNNKPKKLPETDKIG